MKYFTLLLFIVFICTVSAVGQDNVQSFLDNARRFEFYKKYDEAIGEINKAIEIQPYNSDLYLKRANIYKHIKDDKAVLKDVQTAISFNPNDENLLESAARELNLSGQYEEAVKIGDSLISTNERNVTGYRIRYENKFRLGDYVGTIEDILKSHDVFSAFREGVKPNYSGVTRMRYSESFLFKALNNLKDDANIYNYYEELFKFIEVRKDMPYTMASLMTVHSLKITLYANYAILYEEKKSPAETTALFDKIAKELGLENRAEIYKEMGRYDSAIDDLSKVLESNNYKSHYFVERGDLYVLTNQFKKAIADYKLAKTPEKPLDKTFEENVNEKISEAMRKMLEDTTQPQ